MRSAVSPCGRQSGRRKSATWPAVAPIHHRHQELGAAMMVAGTWLRPAVYGKADQEAAIQAEVRAVRNGVGVIDVSTLGKIEVRGPDAAAFMERIYTFAFAAQPVGRVRYALMTDEAGNVMDDGVAARLHAHHFYVTATTGGADGVFRFMQWCNAQWRRAVEIANGIPLHGRARGEACGHARAGTQGRLRW